MSATNYKHITKEEAYALWKVGAAVENRYKNANAKGPWDQSWTSWKPIHFGEVDWKDLDPNQWEDEFRVEVE